MLFDLKMKDDKKVDMIFYDDTLSTKELREAKIERAKLNFELNKNEKKANWWNKNKTNEQYLIETIFNRNYNTVINNLYEILDILKRLFSDVNNRKTIFYELKKRNKEYLESILE